jgi:hypothetical protein
MSGIHNTGFDITVFCICDQAESDSEFDKRYEAYFNRADIDGWEIRKVIILIFTKIMLCFVSQSVFFPTTEDLRRFWLRNIGTYPYTVHFPVSFHTQLFQFHGFFPLS